MSVSVGIPIYNAEKFLENAIKSVLNQTFQDFELILIDDGSTDNSLEIARNFEKMDSRIRVIHDGQNKRLPDRLNQLFLESKFDLIARMDADDIMHPERLERQVDLLRNSSYDLVSTSYFTINSKDRVVSSRIITKEELKLDDFLLGNYYILHPSILAKKSWYLEHLYDPYFDRAEDYELWFRSKLSNTLNIKIMKDSLMFYREEGSVSKSKQLNSYYSTNKILDTYKDCLSGFSFTKAKIRNNLKIIIFKLFYSKAFESYLVKRRNKFNPDSESLESAQKILNDILSS